MNRKSQMAAHTSRGFTLIELLVVVGIIGLLAGLIVVALNSTRARARDARVQSNVTESMTVCQLRNDSLGNYDECSDTDTAVTSGIEVGAISRLDADTAKQNAGVGLTVTKPGGTQVQSACVQAQLNVKSSTGTTQYVCRDYTGDSRVTTNTSPCNATTFTCQ